MFKWMSTLHVRPGKMQSKIWTLQCSTIDIIFPCHWDHRIVSPDTIIELQVFPKNISRGVWSGDLAWALNWTLPTVNLFGYIRLRNWRTTVAKWGMGFHSSGTETSYKVLRLCLLIMRRGMVTAYSNASHLNIFIKEMQTDDSVVPDTSPHRYTCVCVGRLSWVLF